MMENYVCEKCKVEIEDLAEVAFCPKCGKNYHIGCWNSMPNCMACGSFNSDYARTKAQKAAENNYVNYIGQECKVCGADMTENDWIVACLDCNMMYHKDCWDMLSECSSCGQSFNMRAVDVNKSEKYTASYGVSKTITSNNSGMFANIGEKIKGVATFFTVAGIILGVVVCLAMLAIDGELFLPALLTGGVIALIAWVSSFMLYGFGALVSSMQNTEDLLTEVLEEIKSKE